ncbi:hypothetical protein ABZ136_38320, partial [Streptomyces microflavus]|uniref:hypothetical protein n=1 Tax=Streptomyces microflavus TaxID=1919 RepID=UPI0033AD2850
MPDAFRSGPRTSELSASHGPAFDYLPRGARIRKAYRIAAGDPNFQATDDCSVVLKYLPDV